MEKYIKKSANLKKENMSIKKQIKVLIESTSDSSYNAYTKEDMPYGLLGEGKSLEEAKEDFQLCYQEMKETHQEEGMEFTEFDFVFELDTI